MGNWMPRNKKLFVFSVPERQKFTGSKLYQPQANRDSLSRCEDLWIITAAKDCEGDWKRGDHYVVSDGLEFYSEDFSSMYPWEDFKDLPEFAELKEFSDSCDGKVKCTLVPEGALLAQVVSG